MLLWKLTVQRGREDLSGRKGLAEKPRDDGGANRGAASDGKERQWVASSHIFR